MRTLQIGIAEKTSYFSAASLTAATISKSIRSRSGCRRGYTNWKRMRRMFAGSVRCVVSPLVSNSGAGNAPVCASRFFLWRRNCTPSADSNITSASLAQTGVQGTNVSSTLIRKCNHNIHSSIGDVVLCISMFARIVSKLTCKYWITCCSVPEVPLPLVNCTERLCGIAFGLRRVGHASRVLTIKRSNAELQ